MDTKHFTVSVMTPTMATARTAGVVRDRPVLVGEAVLAGLLVSAVGFEIATFVLRLPVDAPSAIWPLAVVGPVLAVVVVLGNSVSGLRALRDDPAATLRVGSVIRGVETMFAFGVLGAVATMATLRLAYGPGGGAVVIALFAVGAVSSVLLAVTVVGHAALALYGARP